MKRRLLLPLFPLLLLSLTGMAQQEDSCNCTLAEQYQQKAIRLIHKYERLSNEALDNSEDRKYARRKFHKQCGGPEGYYFRERLKKMTHLLKPVMNMGKVYFIYEDLLDETNSIRYRIAIKLRNKKTCTLSFLYNDN